MDRGAWRAAAHGVTESRTRLQCLSTAQPPALGKPMEPKSELVVQEKEKWGWKSNSVMKVFSLSCAHSLP